jgi:hypothetical protein
MGLLESGRSERRKRDVEKAVEQRMQLRDKFIGDINKQLSGEDINDDDDDDEEASVYEITSDVE